MKLTSPTSIPTLLAVAVPTALLVLTATQPGLGYGWATTSRWAGLVAEPWIMGMLLAISVATLVIAKVRRDARLLPAGLGGLLLLLAPSPMTIDAPYLTRFDTGIRGHTDSLSLGAMISRLRAPATLPLGGALLPPPVAFEAANSRAQAVAYELEAILAELGGDLPAGSLAPPTPPDHTEPRAAIARTQDALDRHNQLRRTDCNFWRPVANIRLPDKDRNAECIARRDIHDDIEAGLSAQLASLNADIAESDIAHQAALRTYRAQTSAIAKAGDLIAQMDAAQAEAARITRARAVALGTAALVFVAALVTPGITLAVGLVFLTTAGAWLAEPDAWVSLWLHFTAFAIPFMIARLIRGATATNWPLVRLLRPSERWQALRLTLRRSVPIFGGLAALLVVSHWIGGTLRDPLYLLPAPGAETVPTLSAECPVGLALVFRQPTRDGCAPQRPESDLSASFRWHIAEAERHLLISVDLGADAGIDSAETLGQRVLDDFDAKIPRRLESNNQGTPYWSATFDYERCSINPRRWLGCLRNTFRKEPRERYARQFDEVRTTLAKRVDDIIASTHGNLDAAREPLRLAVTEAAGTLITAVDETIWKGFRILDLISFVAFGLMMLALLRALVHVFVRCLCVAPGLEERLLRHPASAGRAAGMIPFDTESLGKLVQDKGATLALQPGVDYRIRAKYTVVNVAAVNVWPRLAFAPRGRFCSYTVPEGSSGTLSFAGAKRIILVNLDSEQSVAFKPASLVGYTKGVRFRTAFYQKVIDLLCGRLRVVTAIGKGQVLLLALGEITTLPKVGDKDTMPVQAGQSLAGLTSTSSGKSNSKATTAQAGQIIAWSPNAQFLAKADDSLVGLYLNAPMVRPLAGGLAIIDKAHHAGKGPRPIGLLAALLSQV